ncbi:MAG: NUDIX hydrolase [Anaerolineales bacterium]|nr:NUDIX hydrolase [Anaerolineales bacterium]
MNPPRWLKWAREIQAVAQTAAHYAHDSYDRARAEQLLELAAEMISTATNEPSAAVQSALTAQGGYITPKVDVRAAVFNQDSLLLVKERADGGWTFPGGWADVGETPRQAVERETYEESGFKVRAKCLIGVYDANRIEDQLTLFHAYKLIFLCEIVGGEARVSNETSGVEFFALDKLPLLLSANRTQPRHIEDAVQAYQNPQKTAVFD